MGEGPATAEETFQIGEVAERVGLSLRTIRHYDEVALVEPSARSAGGFRLYTGRDIDRLAFVKQLKPLDFRIEEMRDLLGTLDQLASTDDPELISSLGDHLEGFVLLAQQRCEALQDQLTIAERVAAALRAELRRARTAST
ncbi:MAG: MerR family transcriptional regulator [Acidimicrobiia bacterium]|nr:MerR family transcriptional regulator [Acidimicrobiia bacterium]